MRNSCKRSARIFVGSIPRSCSEVVSTRSQRTSPWGAPRRSSSLRAARAARRRRYTPSATTTTTRSARTPTSRSGQATGGSILFRCLLARATPALPQHGIPLGEAIARLGATHVSLVSTQLLRLLREDADLGGLEAVLMGGGPVPAFLVDEALARGLPIHTSYGLTE